MNVFSKSVFIVIVQILSLFTYAQDQDLLLEARVEIIASDIKLILAKTEEDVRSFAENFQVRLDSKSKITKAKQVSGSVLEPVLNVTVRKCVFLFCQSIDLDAQFQLSKIANLEIENCDHKYELKVDLSRSSQMLSDLYKSIDSIICIKETKSGAVAQLVTNLIHAETFETGIVQRQAFDLIKLQGSSILDSFLEVMKKFGASSVQSLP